MGGWCGVGGSAVRAVGLVDRLLRLSGGAGSGRATGIEFGICGSGVCHWYRTRCVVGLCCDVSADVRAGGRPGYRVGVKEALPRSVSVAGRSATGTDLKGSELYGCHGYRSRGPRALWVPHVPVSRAAGAARPGRGGERGEVVSGGLSAREGAREISRWTGTCPWGSGMLSGQLYGASLRAVPFPEGRSLPVARSLPRARWSSSRPSARARTGAAGAALVNQRENRTRGETAPKSRLISARQGSRRL